MLELDLYVSTLWEFGVCKCLVEFRLNFCLTAVKQQLKLVSLIASVFPIYQTI